MKCRQQERDCRERTERGREEDQQAKSAPIANHAARRVPWGACDELTQLYVQTTTMAGNEKENAERKPAKEMPVKYKEKQSRFYSCTQWILVVLAAISISPLVGIAMYGKRPPLPVEKDYSYDPDVIHCPRLSASYSPQDYLISDPKLQYFGHSLRVWSEPITELPRYSQRPHNVLRDIETALRRNVLHQDAAIKRIISFLQPVLNRDPDSDPPRFPAMFHFTGPHGVGKTLAARTIARHMFHFHLHQAESKLYCMEMRAFPAGIKHPEWKIIMVGFANMIFEQTHSHAFYHVPLGFVFREIPRIFSGDAQEVSLCLTTCRQ